MSVRTVERDASSPGRLWTVARQAAEAGWAVTVSRRGELCHLWAAILGKVLLVEVVWAFRYARDRVGDRGTWVLQQATLQRNGASVAVALGELPGVFEHNRNAP